MSLRPRALAALLVVVAATLAAGAGTAGAADECNGLQVCLPLEGPWVAIPAGGAGATPRVDYELRCPRRGYIVAGTDVRISDRRVDVAIRGETGSPVAPGTTTRESVVFAGLYAGGDRRRVAFRPFIGCIPTSGGGSRNQTARAASGEGLKPTRPIERLVVNRTLRLGANRVVARCGVGSRLVGGGHAVGFRLVSPPGEAIIGAVTTVERSAGNTVAVTATVRGDALGSRPELQVQALCTRAGR